MLWGGACVRLLWRRSMGPHVSGIGWVVYGDLATGSVCTWNGCTVYMQKTEQSGPQALTCGLGTRLTLTLQN